MENNKNFSEEDIEKAEKTDNLSDLNPQNGEENASQEASGNDEEISRLKDELMRSMAEMENVRKRAQREKEDAMKYGITSFAREILQVADNLERALSSIKEDDRKQNDVINQLFTGVEMTEQLLYQSFEKVGVKKIDPKGEAFDHNFHQAMTEVESDEHESGQVVDVFQPGYIIHDRLLRPAMVSVAKGNKKDKDDKGTEHLDTTV